MNIVSLSISGDKAEAENSHLVDVLGCHRQQLTGKQASARLFHSILSSLLIRTHYRIPLIFDSYKNTLFAVQFCYSEYLVLPVRV